MDHDSFVYCRPEKNWINLFFQRMRWAGDGNIMWKYNIKFFIIMISTVGTNFLLLILLLTHWDLFLLLILALKFSLELWLALLGSYKFNEKISFFDFLYWFIINIPYVCIMCIASFFVKFIPWQNRIQK